jgi:hypothetical protein
MVIVWPGGGAAGVPVADAPAGTALAAAMSSPPPAAATAMAAAASAVLIRDIKELPVLVRVRPRIKMLEGRRFVA